MRILTFFAYLVSYLINRLVFVKIVNWRAPLKLRKKKIPFIYAFWHGRHFYEIFTRRNNGIVVMTSLSRDGEILSQVLYRYGFDTVRGSSSRKGDAAAFSMIKKLKRGKECAIAVDGPKGPERVLKPGVFHLAKASKCPIVPMATAFSKYFVVPSWDKYIIPCPFSKGVVVYGEPIFVPQDADEQTYIKLITQKINQTTELADKIAEGKIKELN
ncbi:MAG: lysophospholipid acyltransferase family protein [Elusimicrobia bacterium]|nr:lysophospholipid acyltransferase family protein [Elusimicrobiota bacterium]